MRRLEGETSWHRQELDEMVNGSAAVVLDVDRDGRQELLVPTPSSLVVIGPGARMAISKRLAGCVAYEAVVVDGDPALACREGAGWRLARWDEDGPASPTDAPAAVARVLDVPQRVGTADLDGDGSSDAVGHQVRGRLELHLGGAARARTIAFPELPAPQANGVVAIAGTSGDVDGDGVEDLVMYAQDLTGDSHVEGTWVLLGRRDGRLAPPLQIDGSRLSPGDAPMVDDLDGDGRDEVVLVGAPPGSTKPPWRNVDVYSLARDGWDRIASYALPRGIAPTTSAGVLGSDGERGVVAAILGSHRTDGKVRLDAGLAIVPLDELAGDWPEAPGPG
jgi:hypothetical protein